MSIGEKGICVRILEKEFRIACPKSQEQALRDAALYLDKQMRIIRQGGRVIGLERIAVMAALNIAHELLLLKSAPVQTGDAFSERLKVLQDKIDGVLSQSDVTPSFKLQQEMRAKPLVTEAESEAMQDEAVAEII